MVNKDKFKEVFDKIYVSFEFRFETVSIILHRNNNSLLEHFKRTAVNGTKLQGKIQ